MKLSISNIAWAGKHDRLLYRWLREWGYSGLEIAPTRIFPEAPYTKIEAAKAWSENLQSVQGLTVSSMQSIWYGRQEKLFGTPEERQSLVEYTKKAVDFAEAVGCKNLVFGCPGNRAIPEGREDSAAVPFFQEIGAYAAAHHTVIAMEANPPVYHTNYINTTEEAIALIEKVDSPGFRLNLDTGTMIENRESVELLQGRLHLVNHVHISEPGLKPIEPRNLHQELRDCLKKENYQKFLSIEMGKTENLDRVRAVIQYVREMFP